MEIKDLLICNDISQIYKDNIILYGTGMWGEKVADCLRKIGKNIFKVCSTYETMELFKGYEIKSIRHIREKYDMDHTLIIIASMDHYKEMVAEYKKLHFEKTIACTLYAFFVSLRINMDNMQLPLHVREELKVNLQASDEKFILNNKLYIFKMLVQAAEAPEDTVLIYQPGKVGSRSIWNFIRNRSIHIHSMVIPYGCTDFSRKVLDYYIKRLLSKKLKIVCGVREPISRDYAAFFQNSECEMWPFSTLNNNVFWWYGDFFHTSKVLTLNELKERNVRWIYSLENTMLCLQNLIVEKKLDEFSWFSYEIKKVFGIDVFKFPFDKKRGYTIIAENNIELFIYKLEKLSTLTDTIADFVGADGYASDYINRNTDKVYTYTYNQLKVRMPITSQYYQYYYDGQYIRHFYTEEEISIYKKHWEKHICSENLLVGEITNE